MDRKKDLLSAATNLPLGDRPNPAQRQVDGDGHDPDDPKHLPVILVVVAEDDGEDDAAQVTRRTGDAGHDACCGDSVSIYFTNSKQEVRDDMFRDREERIFETAGGTK